MSYRNNYEALLMRAESMERELENLRAESVEKKKKNPVSLGKFYFKIFILVFFTIFFCPFVLAEVYCINQVARYAGLPTASPEHMVPDDTYDADDLNWCDLEWCDSIYHRNIGCPRHGQVEIPPEVLAR